MSALSNLGDYLEAFRQLPHHNNPELANRLDNIQQWQRNRMRHTHAKLFAQPNNQKMADYFLNNLYGGETLYTLILQLERIIPKAKKLEMLAPKQALKAGVDGIRVAVQSTILDVEVAEWLATHDLNVNRVNILAAYKAVDRAEERQEHINDLKEICYATDKYIQSFMLRKAFQLGKGQAYKHNYRPLYDFIALGFDAMDPLDSMAGFIEPFCKTEMLIINEVHKPNSTPAAFDYVSDPASLN